MVLDEKVKKTPMAKDLEEIMKAHSGIHLWNMDMKNYIWNNEKAEKEYLKYWEKFYEGYSNLLGFVKDSEKNEYF
jgi:hypothetical protein